MTCNESTEEEEEYLRSRDLRPQRPSDCEPLSPSLSPPPPLSPPLSLSLSKYKSDLRSRVKREELVEEDVLLPVVVLSSEYHRGRDCTGVPRSKRTVPP